MDSSGRHAGLMAEVAGGRPLILAIGYPASQLEVFARNLAAEIEHQANARTIGSISIPVQNDYRSGVSRASADTESDSVGPRSADLSSVTDPPSGSRLRLDRQSDGLTITLEPMGVWRGSKGLFVFGLFWCGFMVVFTPVWFIDPGEDSMQMLFIVPFLLLFWAIGISMLVGAVNMGRRRAILDVVGDTLLVSRQSLFGQKQQEWRAEDLRGIRMGPSGMSVNDVPIPELKIESQSGETLGMASGRSDAELEWIAASLRKALGVGPGGA